MNTAVRTTVWGIPFFAALLFFPRIVLAESPKQPDAVETAAIGTVAPGTVETSAEHAFPAAEGILVDKVHANDNSHIGLREDNYDYHEICGFRQGFDYLRRRGVAVTAHERGLLTAELLAQHRMLFLNLVSAERPPFYVSEINALVDYVRSGGSLLVICDHSNAYFHTWRLAPLLAELDIEVFLETACEIPPHTLGSGCAWILIEDFEPHPMTRGLRRIAFQTGGPVDDRFAVARTSKHSWADRWYCPPYGETEKMGFCGNFALDPQERRGPFGVVLAKEFGKGRIVLVGDQNIFGDTFIAYADNYRLWINAVAWLLRADETTDSGIPADLADPAAFRAFRKPKLLLVEDFAIGMFGTDDKYGCYNLMAWLNRHFPLFCDDRCESDYELLVLPNGHLTMSEEIVDLLAAHLRRGRDVVALHSSPTVVETPDAVLMRLFQKLGIERPNFETLDMILAAAPIETLEGAGTVYLFDPSLNLYNYGIPPPSDRPGEMQRDTLVVLRRQLESLLPGK